MAPILYRASAPGTLMLFGEHAVLHNKRAMVMSINQRVTVTLKPRQNPNIIIQSALGRLEVTLENCTIQKPFQYILTAILLYKEKLAKLKKGFELSIESDFVSTVGLGSSAAVTVATLAVLDQFVRGSSIIPQNLMPLFLEAKTVIIKVQGIGSGADAAASVFGGIIVYQQTEPYLLKHLPFLLPLVTVYSGYKTPTVEVIKQVTEASQKHPVLYGNIFTAMERCALDAIEAIQNERWSFVGEIFNIQQGLMNAIQVSTPLLNGLTDILKTESSIFGAKISGSGLGDCVIGVGTLKTYSRLPEQIRTLTPEAYVLPIEASLRGVSYE